MCRQSSTGFPHPLCWCWFQRIPKAKLHWQGIWRGTAIFAGGERTSQIQGIWCEPPESKLSCHPTPGPVAYSLWPIQVAKLTHAWDKTITGAQGRGLEMSININLDFFSSMQCITMGFLKLQSLIPGLSKLQFSPLAWTFNSVSCFSKHQLVRLYRHTGRQPEITVSFTLHCYLGAAEIIRKSVSFITCVHTITIWKLWMHRTNEALGRYSRNFYCNNLEIYIWKQYWGII